MKVLRVGIGCGALCGILLAAALRGEAVAPRRDSDIGPRIVKQILHVDIAVEESDPPNLVVTAVGQVPSEGYTRVRLVRANYAAAPEDGIQDYFLLAVPPAAVGDAPANAEVQASDKWAGYSRAAPWLRGIRVHGIDDSVVLRELPR